jgi:ABC-type antimicrobial peptide transport system permease subunit
MREAERGLPPFDIRTARRSQIVIAVLCKGLKPAAVGSALGLVLATMLSRGIGNLLYGVAPTGVPTFLSVTLFLFGTAVAACTVPALRATNIAPIVSIRSE